MTFSERLVQLLWVAAYSNKDNAHVNLYWKINFRFKSWRLIFFKEVPLDKKLINRFQAQSKNPYL
jgi:hypothetical protein